MRNVLNIDLRKIVVPEGRMRPVRDAAWVEEAARQHREGATAAASGRGSPQRR